MKNGERIVTLTRLGLTLNEARAYMALAQFGAKGAKEISETSQISKQDIYRVMVSLEQAGIIEKTVSRPTIYRAAPIDQATKILLERKNAQHKDLQKKAKELVTSLKDSNPEDENKEVNLEVVMIPGKELIVKRLKDNLQKAQKALQVVTSRERFAPAILEFKDAYQDAMDRGVSIQIAAEIETPEKPILKIIQELKQKQKFEIRTFTEPPQAIVSIFDEKEATVTMGSAANTPKAQALWSNDASFVSLAQNYFTAKWNNAKKLDIDAAYQE